MRPTPPDERRLRAMFDSVASRYDLLNDLLSFGMDRRWRRVTLRALDVRPHDLVLDVGCGTGRLAALAARICRVIGVDASGAMLAEARNRPGASNRVRLVQASVFRLPFSEGAFSAVMSAFVLRNLDDLEAAFREMARVACPGARIALLDITEPDRASVRRLFDAYFSRAAPALGKISGNPGAYRYLVESLGHLPPADDLVQLLNHTGFRGVSARRLMGGVVTLFTAIRD